MHKDGVERACSIIMGDATNGDDPCYNISNHRWPTLRLHHVSLVPIETIMMESDNNIIINNDFFFNIWCTFTKMHTTELFVNYYLNTR